MTTPRPCLFKQTPIDPAKSFLPTFENVESARAYAVTRRLTGDIIDSESWGRIAQVTEKDFPDNPSSEDIVRTVAEVLVRGGFTMAVTDELREEAAGSLIDMLHANGLAITPR